MQRLPMMILLLLVCQVVSSQVIRLMTYNIRLDLASDGANSWPERKAFFMDQLRFYDPDILGVQEALPHQSSAIVQTFSQFQRVGLGRESNNTGESSSLFIRKEKFSIQDSGTFWLSETPDRVSKGWDASYNRVCTYALVKIRQSGKLFWIFNTHLDHKGQQARKNGVALILSTIQRLNKKNYPVVLMGDFNSEPTSPNIQQIRVSMDDTREVTVDPPYGPAGTFNGFVFENSELPRIDYIFISKKSPWTIHKQAILADSREKRYASDHFPVFTELRYKE